MFSIILEYGLPSQDQPFLMAIEDGLGIMKYAAKEKRISSVAISEGLGVSEGYQLLEVGKHLRKAARRKELIACLSGRRMEPDQLIMLLPDLAQLDVATVCVHGGARLPEHDCDERGQPKSRPGDYMDACRMIHRIRRSWPDVFLGARINPFKYTLPDAHLQYFKMMKSLATGSDFVITQAGWDMKKIHEVQWYQRRRGIEEPVIARLQLLHPGDVSKIVNFEYPGLVISRELGTKVQREMGDEVQGMKASLRRIALQAAGCRLLGCSGIQLAGAHDAITAQTVIDQVFEALEEFDCYERWLEAWSEMHERVEMAPYPDRYYIFRDLLTPGRLDYSDESEAVPDMLEDPPAGERLRYNLAKSLGLDHHDGPIGKMLQRLLCHYQPGKDWHLDKTALICAGDCPKGLEEGPCGESRPDGSCEFGHKPCFYHSVLRLEQWQKNLQIFEEPYEDS